MKKITMLFAFLCFIGMQALFAQKEISGTIISSEDGEVLPGVSVVVKGTTIGTITDFNGKYVLSVPDDAEILVFSFVGMLTQEIPIGESTTIDVTIELDIEQLEEVVVIAYGARKRGALTGAIDVVNAKEIEQVPIASFDQALQGRATGVNIISSSGRPGAEAIVRIRGVSTINASTDPLYVIDGVPVESDNFAAFNPNDIESISVLKDASSASLYGSRAANGVIIVTTKKGKSGKMNIDYRFLTGWSGMTKPKFDMMNAREKLQYEIETGYRTGADADPAVVDSLAALDHNWRDDIVRTGRTNSHELVVSGGTEKVTYYISGSMFNQEGLTDLSYLDRISGRMNLTVTPNEKLTVSSKIFVGYFDRAELRDRRNVQNPFFGIYIYNPYEPVKNPDGSWNVTNQGFNVLEALEKNPEVFQQLKSVGVINAEYEFIKNVSIYSSIGIDYKERTRQYYCMPSSILASYVGDIKRDNFLKEYTTVNTNYLTYRNTFTDIHNVVIKGGIETQMNHYYFMHVAGEGFASDKMEEINSAATITDGGGERQDWGIISFFSLLHYDLSSKYLVDFSIRRDGSSRFGEDYKWGDFWSAGFGWNIHEEAFFAPVDLINQLKLRSSFGTSGNFRYLIAGEEEFYRHLALYTYTGYNNETASYPVQPGNPELRWEKTFQSSVGVEYTIVNNRISGDIGYFHKKTIDLFYPANLSRTSGFSSRLQNIGEIVNQGFEFSINADIVKTSDLLCYVGGNISTSKAIVTELYEGKDNPDFPCIHSEGEPLYSYYLVRYAGVNPSNGDALYYDVNGNITNEYNPGRDRVILDKTPFPKFYGAITTGVNYKGLGLDAFFYYNYGNYIFSYMKFMTESDGTNITDNQSRTLLDRWKKPGDVTDIPRSEMGNERAWETDRNLDDGSYLRLRDLTVYYQLPTDIVSRVNLRAARVYVKGTNLFTITKYMGFDPEIGYSSRDDDNNTAPVGSFNEITYPTIKTFSIGVDIGL